MLLMVLLLLNPCHPSDSIGVDSASFADFNGYQYVYSVNIPALYTDTYLMDDQGNIIGHVPLPTPIGTYGPAHRVVVCYNPDIENLYADGRMTRPVPTTTTTEVPPSPAPTTPPTTSVPNEPLKATPVPAAVHHQTRWTMQYQLRVEHPERYGTAWTTCGPCVPGATRRWVAI